MGRLGTAFRAFFGSLFNRETASRIDEALSKGSLAVNVPAIAHEPGTASKSPASEATATSVAAAAPKPSPQHSAITLLATLQREARLVDFLMEDLAGYTDEQVGAAVRAIQRDSSQVIERLFSIKPIVTGDEGTRIDIPAGFDAARFRLTGKVAGTPPLTGTLHHHGWEVTRCELPQFTGSDSAARIVAPAEIQVE